MRKIVSEFIENPSPKLRAQLTTEELRYAQRVKKSQKLKDEKPVVEQKDSNPTKQ